MPMRRMGREEGFARTSSPQMRKFFETYPPKMMMRGRDKPPWAGGPGGGKPPQPIPPVGFAALKFNFKTNSQYMCVGF